MKNCGSQNVDFFPGPQLGQKPWTLLSKTWEPTPPGMEWKGTGINTSQNYLAVCLGGRVLASLDRECMGSTLMSKIFFPAQNRN